MLSTLRATDRRVAVALMEESPAEASHRLGVARSTIYAHIQRLRSAFQAAGLGPLRCGVGEHLHALDAGEVPK